MYSLIITIVSIALVVALIGATMYYGGDTLTEGRAKSDAAAYVSGGQQIVGALQMHNAMEGTAVAASDQTALTTALVPKYLSSLPVMKGGGVWATTAGSVLTMTAVPNAACDAINSQVGITTSAVALAAGEIYKCVGDGEGVGVLNMRY